MIVKQSMENIVDLLAHALNKQAERIDLHAPVFKGNEWTYVKECLDTGWVSSGGSFVDKFESELTNVIGAKKAVAVVNGTAALHMALQLVGVRQDDEVLVPALTFVATANAISYCGAIPNFVDIDQATLGVDPVKLRFWLESNTRADNRGCTNKSTGRMIRALVVMHTFGHPADMDAITELAQDFGIEVVEDAAQALGSLYKGVHVGNFGRVSSFSFNGNKIITTGGGGAIITNDEELGAQAKHLTTTAKEQHPWQYCHDQIGFNYRLPNINAALGCAQLEQLAGFIEQKRALFSRYKQALSTVSEVTIFQEVDYARSNYWLNALILAPSLEDQLEPLLELTHARGMMTRPTWKPMHDLVMYSTCPRMNLDVTQSLHRRLLNIPSGSALLGG